VVVAQSSTPNAGYENPNAVTTTTGAGAQSASETASNVAVTTTGVPNGNFETGEFTHWNGANQIGGSGDWFVYEGTTSPLINNPIAAPRKGTLLRLPIRENLALMSSTGT
jgi:hypothetical protein